MERGEKTKVEKAGMEEKRRRRSWEHTAAEEKCRAVLLVWTERRRAGEVCRDLGVDWGVLKRWQSRAMEGMLQALQPRAPVERGVALSPHLAVLLKRGQAGMMRRLDLRLRSLQGDPKAPPEPRGAAAEKKV